MLTLRQAAVWIDGRHTTTLTPLAHANHRACPVDEQAAQIGIATSANVCQTLFATRRMLSGYETEVGCQICRRLSNACASAPTWHINAVAASKPTPGISAGRWLASRLRCHWRICASMAVISGRVGERDQATSRAVAATFPAIHWSRLRERGNVVQVPNALGQDQAVFTEQPAQ